MFEGPDCATSPDAHAATGQTVNYFCPILKGAKIPILWPFVAIVRQRLDVSVEDCPEIIEDEGVGDRYLLGSQGVITFALEGAIGSLEPLTKPK